MHLLLSALLLALPALAQYPSDNLIFSPGAEVSMTGTGTWFAATTQPLFRASGPKMSAFEGTYIWACGYTSSGSLNDPVGSYYTKALNMSDFVVVGARKKAVYSSVQRGNSPGGASVMTGLDVYDSSNNRIASWATPMYSGTGWQKVWGTLNLPTTAAYGIVRLYVNHTGSDETSTTTNSGWDNLVLADGNSWNFCDQSTTTTVTTLSGGISDGPFNVLQTLCTWYIQPAAFNGQIWLDWISVSVGADTITVFDSSSTSGTKLQQVSGSSTPASVKTSGSVMTVQYLVTANKPVGFSAWFTAIPYPTITSLSPTVGQPSGILTIRGTGFGTTLSLVTVTIGTLACPVSSATDTEAQCTLPTPSTFAAYSVTICRRSVCNQAPLPTFTYSTMTLSSLTPGGGTTGTQIQIFGTFTASASSLAVTITNSAGTAINCPILSGSVVAGSPFNSLICTAPDRGAIGISTVKVSVSGSVLSSSLFFEYVATPGISAVSPPFARGSLALALTVSGLSGAVTSDVSVSIDGSDCPIVSLSSTSISCTLPSLADGPHSVSLCHFGVCTANGTVTYQPYPVITSLAPTNGLAQPITLTGTNFGAIPAAQTVTVASLNCPITSSSPTTVICTAPALPTGTIASVILSFYSLATQTPGQYIYTSAPTITAVNPAGGAPGSSFTITGGNLGTTIDSISVTLGTTPCTSVTASTGASLICFVPAALPLGLYNLTVSVNSVSSTSSFNVVNPSLSSISPVGGTLGATLTLVGAFGYLVSTSFISVTIGTSSCSIVSASAVVDSQGRLTQIACTVPTLSAGTSQVVLSHYSTGSNSLPFVYVVRPVITSLSPSSGIAGTVVTINGQNLGNDPAVISVSFGVLACSLVPGSLTVSSVSCISPGPNAGPVNVTVSVYSAASGPSTFNYITVPAVTSVYPTIGADGTTVTIVGTGFGCSETDISVTIGGVSCAIVANSLASCSQIVCTAAVSSLALNAAQPLVLSRLGVSSSGLGSTFTFVLSPAITSISPSTGVTGQLLTIAGTGFGNTAGDLAVTLGTSTCSGVAILSADTQITCTVPSGTGANSIVVRRQTTSSASFQSFTFLANPTIVTWTRGGYTSGFVITISGGGFGTTESALNVTVGTARCAVVPGSLDGFGSRFSCNATAQSAGRYTLLIRRDNVTSNSVSVAYISVLPALASLTPSTGQAGTALWLVASNLQSPVPLTEADLKVTIRNIVCTIVTGSLNATALSCTVPPGAVGVASVRLTLFDYLVSPQALNFTYSSTVSIYAVTPKGGLLGTTITIDGGGFGSSESNIAVTVGGAPCTVVPFSLNSQQTQVRCVVTLSTTSLGPKNVTLSNGGAPVLGSPKFEYIAAPVISSIRLPGGAAGDTITITGTGFGTSQTDSVVTIDTQTCLTLSLNDTSIRCIVPVGVVGSRDTIVKRYAVSSAPAPFVFAAPVPVFAVIPGGGLPGTAVTISGSFSGVSSLISAFVGGLPCPITPNSFSAAFDAFECTVDASLPVGDYAVVVTYYSVSSTTSVTWSHIPPPNVTTISPVGGRSGLITVYGTGFGTSESDLAVSFGTDRGVIATGTLNGRGTQFQVRVPSTLSVRAYPVSVARFGVSAPTQPVYTYIAQPVVNSVVPAGGTGAVPITVQGLGFGTDSSTARVLIGSSGVCTITQVNDTFIVCTTPAEGVLDQQFVVVERFGITSLASSSATYTYINEPAVFALQPLGGLAPVRITLTGSSFGTDLGVLSIAIGSNPCVPDPQSLNALGTSLVCTVAAFAEAAPASLPLSFSRYGVPATASIGFSLVERPIVTSFAPLGGQSGNTISIFGDKFGVSLGGQVSVTVAGYACAIQTATATDSFLECRLPSAPPGTVGDVRVSNYDAASQVAPSAPTFIFIDVPIVTALNPAGGVAGSQVTILGTRFGLESQLSVFFNQQPCPVVPSGATFEVTSVVCIAPNIADPNVITSIPVSVVRFNTPSRSPDLQFQYVPPPTATSLSPSGGTTGQRIQINGFNFGSDIASLTVTVGGVPATVTSLTALGTSLQFLVPTLAAPGPAVVVVSHFGVASQPLSLFYIDQPVGPVSILPLGGVPGTVLRLQAEIGSLGFPNPSDLVQSGELSITVNSQPCPVLSVSNDPQLQLVSVDCSAPITTLGPQDVVLSRFGVAAPPALQRFTYVNTPVIILLNPPGGQAGGILEIEGNNFDSDESSLAVVFNNGNGQVPCPIITGSLSSQGNSLRCSIPLLDAGFIGEALVSVVRYDAVSSQTAKFTYIATPVILSVSPRGGVQGDLITLSGQSFGSAATGETGVAISINEAPCEVVRDSLQLSSNTSSVVCQVPAGPLGTYSVHLEYFGIVAGGAASFSYAERPKIQDLLDPRSSLPPGVAAGDLLTIVGQDFGDGDDLSVTFDGLDCPIYDLDAAETASLRTSAQTRVIRCTVPQVPAGPLERPVAVVRFQLQSTSKTIVFVPRPALNSLFPVGGKLFSDAKLTLTGSEFGTDESLIAVSIGSLGCTIVQNTLNGAGTRVECLIPTGVALGAQNVVISRYGAKSNPQTFFYVTEPTITQILPSGGTESSVISVEARSLCDENGASINGVTVTIGSVACVVTSGPTCPYVGQQNQDASVGRVSCRVPAGTGTQPLQLYHYDVPSVKAEPFLYVQEPVLVAIEPVGGRQGTVVTLQGQHLGPNELAISITIGGYNCPVVEGSLNAQGTTVACRVPLLPCQDVDQEHQLLISVFNVPCRTPAVFEYVGVPIIRSIAPEGGIKDTPITIVGDHLGTNSQVVSVTVGGDDCVDVLATSTVLTCTVGTTFRVGVQPVVVRHYGVSSQDGADLGQSGSSQVLCTAPLATNISLFNFVEAPSISFVTPRGGLAGDVMKVQGEQLEDAPLANIRIEIGEDDRFYECKAFKRESRSIFCRIPRMPENETSGVRQVYLYKYAARSNSLSFDYLQESEMFYMRWSDPFAQFVAALVAVSLVYALLIMAGIWKFRETPVMKGITPMFSLVICFGCILGLVGILFYIGRPSEALCTVRIWLSYLAFVVIFSNLLGKTWRVWRIFENKQLRKITITNTDLAQFIGVLVMLEVLGLLIWSAKDTPGQAIWFGSPSAFVCSSNNSSLYEAIQLIYRFLLLFGGCFLAWNTRNVISRFNESKDIGLSMYTYLIVSFLQTALQFTLAPNTLGLFAVQALGDLVVFSVILTRLYALKIIRLVREDHSDLSDHSDSRNSRAALATQSSRTSVGEMPATPASGPVTSSTQHSDRDTDDVMLAWGISDLPPPPPLPSGLDIPTHFVGELPPPPAMHFQAR
eukprot:TRINITY_DN1376_c0_g1_i3.p1 TRINITY_DN1376_c0_g1~~TRINITY_DN1376_c0_g1_i3.p1  ORF type:complete len:3289 (+),score=642.11 TRINITY_DN1376_c0_g1_i3:45-9911(+)